MKILILGGGQVGKTVAQTLASYSNHSITIIDINENVVQNLGDNIDVRSIIGNATSPSLLELAEAENSDLLLALTKNDDTNLVACLLGKQIFNIPNTIARIRHSDITEYKIGDNKNSTSLFGVNKCICPEQLITEQIFQLLQYSGALQVLSLANNAIKIVATRVEKGSLLIGRTIEEIKEYFKENELDVNIFNLYRNNSVVIPKDITKIIKGDEVFFTTKPEYVQTIINLFNRKYSPTKKIIIAGGGNIGYRLAKQAENFFDIKIIERNKNRATWLSEKLDSSLVLYGSGTDESILNNEHINDVDVFCALTNDDEVNVMSSFLAKKYGAKRVITIINRTSYVGLLQGNKIDIIISPYLTTIGSILANIRRGDIECVHPLRNQGAEILEIVIHGDKKTSKIIDRKNKKINWPLGCHIIAVIKNNEYINIFDDYIFEDSDHLIFFLDRAFTINELEKLLQVKWKLF